MVEINLKRIEPYTVFIVKNTGELTALQTILTDAGYRFLCLDTWNNLKRDFDRKADENGLGISVRGREMSLGYAAANWYSSEAAQGSHHYKTVNLNEIEFIEEENTMSKTYLDLNNLTTTNTIIYCETEDEIRALFEIVQRKGKRAYHHGSAPYGFRLSREGNIVNGASGNFYDSAEGIRNFPGPRYNFSELKFDPDEGSLVGLKLNPEKVRALYGQDVHVVVTNPKERRVFLNGLTEMGLRWAAGQSPWGFAPSETNYGFLSNGRIVNSREGDAVSVSSLLVDGAEIPDVPDPDPEIWNGRKYDVAKYFGTYACIRCETPEEARLLKEYAEHYLGCTVMCGEYRGDLYWKMFHRRTAYAVEGLFKGETGRQNMRPLNCDNSWNINGRNIVKFSDVVTPAEGKYEFVYEELEDGTFRLEDGRVFTQEEFDQRFVLCADCGNAIPKENAQDIGGDLVCMDCALSNHSMCSKCGEWICDGDEIEIEDEIFCDDCAQNVGFRCAYCEEWHFNSDGVYMEDTGNTFCSDCASDYAYRCDDCGNWYEREDNIYYCDRDGHDYCESCYDDHCHSDGVLSYHSHHMNRAHVFYLGEGEKRGETVVLGAEHEVDEVSDMEGMVEDLQDEFEDFYVFEEDGSLGDRGVEIISYPASLSEHLKRLPDLRRICRNYDAVSHNSGNCGLHIHIDRQYMSRESDIAKLCFLFERHWDNLVIFARRTNDQLHWCRKNRDEYGGASPVQIAKRDKDGNNPTRYCAINLTNSHTVEIRLWRGTLNLLTMKATFKLTARLAELAKNTPIAKLYKMKWEDILGDDEDIKAYWATRVPATVEGAYDQMAEESFDPVEED